jgi:hypothetical protein
MELNAYLPSVTDTQIEKKMVFIPGIWADGKVEWLESGFGKILLSDELSIEIKQANIHSKVEFYDLYVTNHSSSEREVKLILMQRLAATQSEQFSFVSPKEDVIFQVAEKRIFLMNGISSYGRKKQCTVQPLWNNNTERLWNCQKTGRLNYQPLAKGSAACLISLDLNLGPGETQKSTCWTIDGTEKLTVLNLNQMLLKNTLAFPDKK